MNQDICKNIKYGIEWTAFSEAGPEGCRNEDFVHCDSETGLFLVADGMGGRPGGDYASRIGAEAFAGAIRAAEAEKRLDAEVLQDGINMANSAVRHQASKNPLFQGMSTTLTALVIAGDSGKIVHVGDSSIYLWRKRRLSRLNQDHTLVEELISQEHLSPAHAKNHTMRNVLSRSIGGEDEVEAEIHDVTVCPGDKFILATDGLKCLTDRELERILNGYFRKSTKSIAVAVQKTLRKQKSTDDVSVVVVAPSLFPIQKGGFLKPKKNQQALWLVPKNSKTVPEGVWNEKPLINPRDTIVKDIETKLHEIAAARNQIAEIEKEQQSKHVKRLLELLEVIDAFERVFGNIHSKKDECTRQMNIWIGNFRTVYRLLNKVLANEGVTPIENLDQGFDPEWHAVSEKIYDPERPEGTIAIEIRRGYVLHGKLLRRSTVVITTDEQDNIITDDAQDPGK